jgi:hypothetical protein
MTKAKVLSLTYFKKLTPRKYHHISLLIWKIALMSALLDFYLDSFIIIPNSIGIRFISALLFIISITALFRDQIISLATTLESLREKNRSKLNNVLLALSIAMALFIAIEVGIKFGQTGFLPGIFIAIIILRALWSLRKEWQKEKGNLLRMSQDRSYWIEVVNFRIFIIIISPIIAARALQFILLNLEAPLFNIYEIEKARTIFLMIVWLLFFASYPTLQSFASNCRGCGARVSRAIEKLSGCPSCKKGAFAIVSEKRNIKKNFR